MNKVLEPKNILLITLSNLGDVVLTTPVLTVLHETFPHASLSVLAGVRPAGLFEAHPWILHIYRYNKKASFWEKVGLILTLRREKFDLVVDLRHSFIPFLIGAKRANSLIRWPRRNGSGFVSEEHLSVLEEMGLPCTPRGNFPFYDAGLREHVIGLLKQHDVSTDQSFVVMVPGARSHLKRWPADRFRVLALMIHRRYHMSVVLLGDREEAPICADVASGLGKFVVNLCGKTSVREFAVIIGLASLVVTNDSAALHLADQQNRPVVAIFGPTDEKRYGPRGRNAKVVRKKLFCAPCGKAQCPYQHECMNELDTPDVLGACLELFSEIEVSSCSSEF